MVLLDTHHPGVAEPAGAAQEAVVGDTQFLHGGAQLTRPVRAESTVTVGGEMGEFGRDDLTLLAEGAGHQRHLGALGRVPGHGRAVVDRLVVRMRVHQEQTPVGQFRHGPTLRGPGARPESPWFRGSRTGQAGNGSRAPGPGVVPAGAPTGQNLMLPIIPAMFVVRLLIVGAIVEEAR